MLAQSCLQVVLLDLLCYVLDVAQDAILVCLRDRDRLGAVVSFRVTASCLPLVLSGRGGSGGGLGGLSRRSGRLRGRRSCWGSRSLLGGRGGGGSCSLREGDDGSRGAGSGSSPACPGHGLRRLSGSSGLGSRRLAGSNGSRARVSRLLRLLGVLLFDLAGSLLRIGRCGGLDGSGNLFLGGSGGLSGGLSSGVTVDRDCVVAGNLLQSIIDSASVKGSRGRGSFLDNRLSLGYWLLVSLLGGGSRSGRGGSRSLLGGLLSSGLALLLFVVLIKVAKNVVQDEVTRRLLGKNKSLDELLGVIANLVGGLANDLDNNVVVRSLGVDVGDADLAAAVREVETLNALLDVLSEGR